MYSPLPCIGRVLSSKENRDCFLSTCSPVLLTFYLSDWVELRHCMKNWWGHDQGQRRCGGGEGSVWKIGSTETLVRCIHESWSAESARIWPAALNLLADSPNMPRHPGRYQEPSWSIYRRRHTNSSFHLHWNTDCFGSPLAWRSSEPKYTWLMFSWKAGGLSTLFLKIILSQISTRDKAIWRKINCQRKRCVS